MFLGKEMLQTMELGFLWTGSGSEVKGKHILDGKPYTLRPQWFVYKAICWDGSRNYEKGESALQPGPLPHCFDSVRGTATSVKTGQILKVILCVGREIFLLLLSLFMSALRIYVSLKGN